MLLLDLPLFLFQEVLTHVCQDEATAGLLPLRRVNRLFDVEVTKYLGKCRMQNLEQLFRDRDAPHCDRRPMQRSFELRLLFESVGAQYAGQNRFKEMVHSVTDALQSSLVRQKILLDRQEVLWTVCEVIVDTLAFSTIAGHVSTKHQFLIPKPLNEAKEIERGVFTIAVAAPYPQLYQSMLQKGFRPVLDTQYLRTPLRSAVERAQKEAVECLLNHESMTGASASGTLEEAFETAARKGNMDMTSCFLASHIGLYKNSKACMRAATTAIQFNNADIANAILEPYYKLSWSFSARRKLCIEAAKYGANSVLLGLLNDQIDVTQLLSRGIDEGFINGVRQGCPISSVRLLLDHGADIDEAKAFGKAAEQGRLDLMELFVSRGADLKKEYSELNYFSSGVMRSIGVLQFLLDQGVGFNTSTSKGWAQAMMDTAARRGQKDTVRWFAENLGLQVTEV